MQKCDCGAEHQRVFHAQHSIRPATKARISAMAGAATLGTKAPTPDSGAGAGPAAWALTTAAMLEVAAKRTTANLSAIVLDVIVSGLNTETNIATVRVDDFLVCTSEKSQDSLNREKSHFDFLKNTDPPRRVMQGDKDKQTVTD